MTGQLKKLLLNKACLDESGCLVWTGGKVRSGYGRVQIDGVSIRTHRLSYAIFKGDIPPGMFVLHRCDNPACMNPDHLFLGTQADNMADKVAKGRQPCGEANHQAKLTEADIRAIRASPDTQRACAKQFGISQRHVSSIRSGHRWAHIHNGEASYD